MSGSNILKVGVTGGIGSGKSTVCRIFEILGVPCYNSDNKSKWILANNREVKKEIINAFGVESFFSDGVPNTKFLAINVFNNEQNLKKINSILHPKVEQDFREWLEQQSNVSYVIKEAALIFESGSYKTLDKSIVVTAPEELRIQRVLKRDSQRSREQVESIISKQLTDKEKISLTDYVILNDNKTLLTPQVLKVHDFLTKSL